MEMVAIIGMDLAKRSFQVHGATAGGDVLFRKKLSRVQVVPFFAQLPNCTVAMEACATAHDWGRQIGALGHEVKLIPPIYVKPFVKRHKNDAADAEAIAEAASRPTMRTVAVKTPEQQSRAVLFRTRDLLLRQRTQLINALRAHLAEFGRVAPKTTTNIKRLREILEDPENGLPQVVTDVGSIYLGQIATLTEQIGGLEKQVRIEATRDDTARRLQTMPGIGPITATAVSAFAPPMEIFRRGRDFAAWVGLVPKQHSTGGKQKLGRTSKMGQRDIRRLLVIGAMSVVKVAVHKGASEGSWLQKMLARKPRMVVAIALANKMARRLWAMLVKHEDYRDPAIAAA
ncbi:IS110 family transposase [Leisingera sp. JC1]|uniref:IS110 family transposase n=1 Tax=Leisingera sp. JC1 TaxID=1855282 RepID=UPI000802BD88|nr:IS110 family transposase [Leisingera sp. JC1]OBY25233.1 transposase [Leisingera sp. JC1]